MEWLCKCNGREQLISKNRERGVVINTERNGVMGGDERKTDPSETQNTSDSYNNPIRCVLIILFVFGYWAQLASIGDDPAQPRREG